MMDNPMSWSGLEVKVFYYTQDKRAIDVPAPFNLTYELEQFIKYRVIDPEKHTPTMSMLLSLAVPITRRSAIIDFEELASHPAWHETVFISGENQPKHKILGRGFIGACKEIRRSSKISPDFLKFIFWGT